MGGRGDAQTVSRAGMTPAWRAATAFSASTIVCLCVSGGLVTLWPAWQIALLVGLVAGLIAASLASSAACAAVAVALSVALQPPLHLRGAAIPVTDLLLGAFLMAAGAAVVAVAARALRSRFPRRADVGLVAFAVVVIVANLWATTLIIDALPVETASGRSDSLASHLMGRATPRTQMSDDDFYRGILWQMRRGTPFYEAFRTAHIENMRWNADPRSVVNYRLPTVYWMLSALPGKGWGIVYAALVAGTIAVGAAVAVSIAHVRLPLAIVGAAAVAALFESVTTQLYLIYAEPWAATAALVAVACVATAARSARWRVWIGCAVAAALVAALARELTGFVLIAGFASAFLAAPERRRFEVAAWAIGLGSFALAFGAHYLRVKDALYAAAEGMPNLGMGGLPNVAAGLRFATEALGAAWFPLVLAALGIAGAAAFPRWRERAFLLIVTLVPLTAFFFVWNGAVDAAGAPSNYWGLLVTPILFALVPWSFGLLPGVARPGLLLSGRLAAAAEDEGPTPGGMSGERDDREVDER